jgi:hypothetical protein
MYNRGEKSRNKKMYRGILVINITSNKGIQMGEQNSKIISVMCVFLF